MLVEIENLKIAFQTRTSRFEAVRGVSMKLGTEKLGIVGESGSGKSLTARALMKLLPSNADIRADKLSFDGIDVLSASEKQMRQIRGKRAGFILQDPKYSLNPVKTMGAQIAEAWRAHKGGSKRAAMEAAIALLDQVKIRNPRQVASSYAHEVSGGMGQRVMIAMMLAPDPELLIADEPTSALDATVQAEILRLIEELVSERGMGLILISHDLPLVSHFCDRVAVMYSGRVMEELKASELLKAQHPYTQGLLNCIPSLTHPRERLPVLNRDAAWSSL
ncbi:MULTISPECIES: ABC transporter ATP-binding protein [Rhizobium/Agrobacterium group]|jgi:peptide/nickel transport system ATP-binding protein|uniref:ABC transporter ATP-binding protein n=4 Tax=Rhizobium/Agrobacterium group TaxID=227290 RepID=A0A1B9SYY0_AGRTU|nr:MULTISPECIES: ABC transporter ATP-binding protein [Rhizobium/Agrobacterium group]AHK02344.1 dipeptide transport ATP-binding protein DppD [Agrobacterium tumefaciens LBA4213 (Ach5)]AKC08159.1 peptide/nickel transport system ATP-binding protein [Agrobacterium tumefaciens]EHJ99016.1 dipeptide ABC transporter nucleotide-binding protein/ATPase [Agrobacterium tumefaciens 5A]MCP2133767.1 peptide/nickel transport system ATP-binding protein [Rhizobium sp. SLBN-94]MDP9561196.1 peptide/nickel transport